MWCHVRAVVILTMLLATRWLGGLQAESRGQDSAVTSTQAEEILKELREIRRLLQRIEARGGTVGGAARPPAYPSRIDPRSAVGTRR